MADEGFAPVFVFQPGIMRDYPKLFFPPEALIKSQSPQLFITSSTSIRATKALQSLEKSRSGSEL